jgi:hypothetical protein
MLLQKLFVQARFISRTPNYRIQNSIKQKFKDAFGKHLLFTNIWTSGFLMVAGDLIQQEIEFQSNLQAKRYDWARAGKCIKNQQIHFQISLKLF